MELLTVTKDVSIIVAGVVALTTFLSGVLEYWRQGHQRRGENFVQMRRRFLENPTFRDISNLLQTDDAALKALPIQDRRNYVGFLEEVALMVESRLIRREVAHAMFGYYVGLVAKSPNFWTDLDRDSRYWRIFRTFAAEVEAGERQPALPTKKLKV